MYFQLMSQAGKFVEEHPFLTFFIAMAAIDGVVAIAKTIRGPACPQNFPQPLASGTRFTVGTRWPFVEVATAPEYDVEPVA